ncbi:DNA-directed RNA polymerase [Tricharina praecox]|uniref:DNA-directed RNA polymerase n=1 Tax=Tricharina praecox TaxID=43433 RepID=UPI00221FAD2E|nr:DNA-directed RNA polymerase [Tricharina praecox]KAI5854774.1 DNA-directed RNA polymerase [Tricharina praecox]
MADNTTRDVEMAETEGQLKVEINGEKDDTLRIKTLPGAEPGCASFEIEDEDHTLGNALRYMIMKNPKVELCGYSIPHPSENHLNMRIQIYPEFEDEHTPADALIKGLDDLSSLCGVVQDKFTAARDGFGKN